MKPKLLKDTELEWSATVANNSMNRERKAFGVNSYEKEIPLNPVDFLTSRQQQETIHWTDLCCGTGNALIQAAAYFKEKTLSKKLSIHGIDLVDHFSAYPPNSMLELSQLNLSYWNPTKKSDLITCIHGLHYIGDKLGLILQAAAALKKDGVFIGNLDLRNIRMEGMAHSEKAILAFFKRNKIAYNKRKKIIKIEGHQLISATFLYVGADDKAGPNYTGQAAVNSYYKLKEDSNC